MKKELARFNFLIFIAGFTLLLSFQTAWAQTAQKISAKAAALIARRLKEAQRPDYLEGKIYLKVTIGKTAYRAAFDSGKVVGQQKAKRPSGGFYGAYAEINVTYETDALPNGVLSENELWKLSGGQWKKVAFKEGDYQCRDVESVPENVLKALKVKCID